MTHTPNGLMPSHCVREVPSDSIISNEKDFIRITMPNGEEDTLAHCDDFTTTRNARDTGWIAYASDANGSNYNSFYGTWNVPENPTNNDDQTVFFFLGFENTQVSEIIQPTLQWGLSNAGGGNFWAIASWWATAKNSIYSTLQSVDT